MTRIGKLYASLLAGTPLRFEELERLVRAFGFELDRVKGSHHIYRQPGVRDRLNIQPVGKMAKAYQLRQFVDMIAEYGLSLKDEE